MSLWLRYDGIPLKRLFHDRQPVQHLQEAHLVLALLLATLAVIFLLLYFAGGGDILAQLLGGLAEVLQFERYDKRALEESIELLSSALALFASFQILVLARSAMNVSLPEIEGQEVSPRMKSTLKN